MGRGGESRRGGRWGRERRSVEQRIAIEGTDTKKNGKPTVALALAAVYFFWGGTYLAMKIAIESMPPFLMAGVRFSVAGWALYLAKRAGGAARPTLGEWKNAAIVGALMMLFTNGLIVWAEQQVPSAIASVLVATVPLWIALIGYITKQQKANAGSLVGIALGLCGIAVLVWSPKGSSWQSADFWGIPALIFSSVAWSVGSVFSRKAKLPAVPLLSTGAQMIVGGALLLLLAAACGEFKDFHPAQVTLRSWLALGYLVVCGSLLGYTSYIWLMKNAEPSLVSTYAFVNPVVAVFLGWLVADETFGANAVAAAAIIVVAVAIMTLSRNGAGMKKLFRRIFRAD